MNGREKWSKETSRPTPGARFVHRGGFQTLVIDGDRETRLTSTASADEPQVVELGYLILHQSRGISQLGAAILIVTGAHGHQGTVAHLAESHDLERYR